MSTPLRVLIVEDAEDDAMLLVRALRRGYDPLYERVDTVEGMRAALAGQAWDLVLADYVLPHFSGLAALAMLQETALDLPCIIVSGKVGEDVAVEAMRRGAHDYVMKDRLMRLVPAVERTLRESEVRRERRRAEQALRRGAALDRVHAKVFGMRRPEDIDIVLMAIYRELQALSMTFNDCSISLLKEGTEPPEFEAYCISSERVWVLAAPAGSEQIRKIWHGGEPVYRSDLDRENRYGERGYMDGVWEKRIRSVVDVPFSNGTLAINSVEPDAFSDEDIELLKGCAGVLSEGYTRVRDLARIEESAKELREREEKYRDLFENARDVIAILDLKGDVTSINKAAAEYGIQEDDIMGRNMLEFVPQKYWPRLRKALAKMARGKPDEGEIELITPKGKKIVECKSNPIRRGKKVIGYQTILRDITTYKRAEEELRKAYSELKEAHERLKEAQQELIQSEKLSALGRFASGIAHEVKNPLAIILSGLEFLEMKLSNADTDTKITIEKIEEATLRADHTLGNLLTFSRPSELKTERVKPDDLIGDIWSLLQYRAPLINVELKTQFAEEEIYVEIDKNQMEQVLFNILVNSVEAMPHGGEIRIKTYRTSLSEFFSGRPCCVIEIADTGEGIPEDNLPKVFDPFFTTKRDKKGTGLGLFVSKAIVNNHGGDLVIDSEQGKGTDVKVILP